jgi:hypothetical protein
LPDVGDCNLLMKKCVMKDIFGFCIFIFQWSWWVLIDNLFKISMWLYEVIIHILQFMFSEEKLKYICKACIKHINRICCFNDYCMRRLFAKRECSFVIVNSWLSGLYGEWSVVVAWRKLLQKCKQLIFSLVWDDCYTTYQIDGVDVSVFKRTISTSWFVNLYG